MSVDEYKVCVCDLFDRIKNHYKESDEIDTDLLNELIQEIQKFKGSENIVAEIKKEFKRIENSYDDDESDDESSAATDEWRFSLAISIFKKFQMKFDIERKTTTDVPVQQVLPQADAKASEQALPQLPKSTAQKTEK